MATRESQIVNRGKALYQRMFGINPLLGRFPRSLLGSCDTLPHATVYPINPRSGKPCVSFWEVCGAGLASLLPTLAERRAAKLAHALNRNGAIRHNRSSDLRAIVADATADYVIRQSGILYKRETDPHGWPIRHEDRAGIDTRFSFDRAVRAADTRLNAGVGFWEIRLYVRDAGEVGWREIDLIGCRDGVERRIIREYWRKWTTEKPGREIREDRIRGEGYSRTNREAKRIERRRCRDYVTPDMADSGLLHKLSPEDCAIVQYLLLGTPHDRMADMLGIPLRTLGRRIAMIRTYARSEAADNLQRIRERADDRGTSINDLTRMAVRRIGNPIRVKSTKPTTDRPETIPTCEGKRYVYAAPFNVPVCPPRSRQMKKRTASKFGPFTYTPPAFRSTNVYGQAS